MKTINEILKYIETRRQMGHEDQTIYESLKAQLVMQKYEPPTHR